MRVILSTVVPHEVAERTRQLAERFAITQSFLIRVILERIDEETVEKLLKGGQHEAQ